MCPPATCPLNSYKTLSRAAALHPPSCSVRDPASGMELCRFELDDVPAAQRAEHSSVVMLKVFRGAVAGRVS